MKRINRDGPPVLGGFAKPVEGDLAALDAALKRGTAVIDLRPATAFATGHIVGTVNIPLNKSFAGWAGWLVRYDVDIHLIAGRNDIERAVRELAMIGLDRVATWYDPKVIDAARAAGRTLGTVAKTTVGAVAPRVAKGEVTFLDVRNRSEFSAGHVPGSLHIPVGHLRERLAELPRDKPIIVSCQSGGRSAIATSVLQQLGVTNATDLTGGFTGWQQAGEAVER
jgi:hydroxyacylglutathione hydrolase